MNYPQEVKNELEKLDRLYKPAEFLDTCDIVHLYPTKKLCYPNGYYDSQWFELWMFNTRLGEKNKSKRPHDQLGFENCFPKIVRIFADGSILIRFSSPVFIDIKFQGAVAHGLVTYKGSA